MSKSSESVIVSRNGQLLTVFFLIVAVIFGIIIYPPFVRKPQYQCPSYGNIISDKMSLFNISKMSGVWYMLATTEPTMPSFCSCGVLNYQIEQTWYSYNGSFICSPYNLWTNTINVTIKGELSSNDNTNGFLHETISIYNQTIGPLLPYMIFDYLLDEKDELHMIRSYACVNERFQMFSYNLLSRTSLISTQQIENIVLKDKEKYKDVMNFEHLTITNSTMFAACRA